MELETWKKRWEKKHQWLMGPQLHEWSAIMEDKENKERLMEFIVDQKEEWLEWWALGENREWGKEMMQSLLKEDWPKQDFKIGWRAAARSIHAIELTIWLAWQGRVKEEAEAGCVMNGQWVWIGEGVEIGERKVSNGILRPRVLKPWMIFGGGITQEERRVGLLMELDKEWKRKLSYEKFNNHKVTIKWT